MPKCEWFPECNNKAAATIVYNNEEQPSFCYLHLGIVVANDAQFADRQYSNMLDQKIIPLKDSE